ncbi:MAG: hypothetical protein V2L15_09995, partial [Desulfobacteraceae bacterium]|nr:hypothetical protein [Desulfobacteraceae bacterium]
MGIEPLTDETLASALHEFFEQSSIREPLQRLVRRLPSRADVLIAGGAIRNLFIAAIHGSAPPTCDIDIFIGGLPADFPLGQALSGM